MYDDIRSFDCSMHVGTVVAETATVNGLTWTYTISEGQASVGGGLSTAVAETTIGPITIPSTLGGYPVTKIGSYAFCGCSKLQSVTIPDGVTNICQYAFESCSGLSSVTISSSVANIGGYAFAWCSGLTSVIIPEGVTNIDQHAFLNCRKLNSVTMSEGLLNVGSYAFAGCSALRTVEIPLSVKSIGACAFSECSELGDGVVIKDGCVLCVNGKCPSEVEFPEETRLIAGGSFWCCNELTSVTIPKGVTSIGNYAFLKCTNLTSVMMHEGLSKIGSNAFSDCSNLMQVTIPSSVTDIGEYAFYKCIGLGSGMVVKDGCVLCINGKCPSVVVLPEGTRLISGGVFSSGLKAIMLPDGLLCIGSYSFYGCSGLTSVIIPSSVKEIGISAFYGCTSLTSVTFEGAPPYGVTLAAIKTDAAIRYNVAYESDWLSVIQQCGWTNATSYQPLPSVPGDSGAVVTYDPENGYAIKPSEENLDVVVSIPSGVQPDMVTVEVGTDVEAVKPNGANVKIVKGGNDITSYLDIPASDPSGTIDLTQATVKEDIVKEALDPEKGAEIVLDAASPSLTTSETKPGLTYTLHEGTTLECMSAGDSKVGDGQQWTPNITVKGGTSGFYSIGVTK